MICGRVLSVDTLTIADTPCMLQILMGWSDTHLHCFVIYETEYGGYHRYWRRSQ
jgi:hypothetical protein